MDDLLSRAGATALATRITNFWARQGIDVQCEVVIVAKENTKDVIFGVRSNIDVRTHIPRAEVGAAIGLGAVEANRRKYAPLLEGAAYGA